MSAPISVHECLVWGDKLWWFARELWLTCVWSEIMESKITHLQNCATAKRHNCWHCRFSFWFCLRFEVKCAFVVSRGLFVDVQRRLWKIDVWKEIVFLVNFGRWDLSCSSEGGIHTYAIHSWVKGTYLLWYIWIQRRRRVPIQTFIWNRVYRKVLTDYMYGKSYLSQDYDTTNKKVPSLHLKMKKKTLISTTYK